MRFLLVFSFLGLFLISQKAKGQQEYLGYSPKALDLMAEEGGDLEKAKIKRFKDYLARLDQLKTAFYEVYDNPNSSADLKVRTESRLEALSALKLNAMKYRDAKDRGDLGQASVSLALYEEALQQLGLYEYFQNLFKDLEGLDGSIPNESDELAGANERPSLSPSNYGNPDPYNIWLSVGPVYNLLHYNSGFEPDPIGQIEYSEETKGGFGFGLLLGYSYHVYKPISVFGEIGYQSQNVSQAFITEDVSIGDVINEERGFNLSCLSINLGLNYYYRDYDFKLGFHYLSHLSTTLEFSYDDGVFSDSGELDLSQDDNFQSSQFLLFFEASYDFYEFELADNYFGVQAFLRPQLGLTQLFEDPALPADFSFKISQINFGLRIQY